MKVVWSRRAERDFHELILAIAEESIQRAELVSARILRGAKLLGSAKRRAADAWDGFLEPASALLAEPLTSSFTESFQARSAFFASIMAPASGPKDFDGESPRCIDARHCSV